MSAPFIAMTPEELDAELEIPYAEQDTTGMFGTDHDPLADWAWWTRRPELKHIYEHARLYRAAPAAVLGYVLARVAAQTPPTVTLPAIMGSPGSLNYYAALVGPSGAGKGRATGAGKSAVTFAGGNLYETAGIGSGEGVTSVFAHAEEEKIDLGNGEKESRRTLVWHTRQALLRVDEIAGLRTQLDRAGSSLAEILLSMWMGELAGGQYKPGNPSTPLPEHEYRAAMTVGVQPRMSAALLGRHASGSGLAQRFLWFRVKPEDQELATLDLLRQQREAVPLRLDLPRWSGPTVLDVDDAILLEIMNADEMSVNGIDPMDTHAMFAREKVAALLAIMRGSTRVNLEDWSLARDVMDHSKLARQDCIDGLAEAAAEENQDAGRGQAQRRIAASDAEAELKAERVTELRRLILGHWKDQGKPTRWAPVRRKIAYRSHRDADLVAMDLAAEIAGFPAPDLEIVA